MKKILSVLMILCMLFAAASVLAEGNEVPTLESMPNVKVYEGLEEPDIALFNGGIRPFLFQYVTWRQLQNNRTAVTIW